MRMRWQSKKNCQIQRTKVDEYNTLTMHLYDFERQMHIFFDDIHCIWRIDGIYSRQIDQ